MAELQGNMEVDGLVRQREGLERLMMSDPAMEKRVQGLIRKVLLEARKKVQVAAKGATGTDPRQAYRAVKTAVYRQILGGSVSILNRRGTARMSGYEPARTLREGQRGGNRVPRGERTDSLVHYSGADRAFVLRFLNSGTARREAGTRGGRLHGNRGRIAARGFFESSSVRAMREAAEELTALIDELIRTELK